MKKVFKIIGIIVAAIIVVLLIGVSILALNSQGKLKSAEKNFIEIGETRQGFFIRGENPENPVILYLHGGPGSPELPIIIPYENSTERLEKYFTVCYWEQRGAGISYSDSIDSATMTTEQFVEDTHEITAYLKQRFKQEKIYLMGHSWGSLLGVKTIEKYPEDYLAYIGIGQVGNQIESEKLAYDYMLQHATDTNDKNAVKKLKEYSKDDANFPDLNYITTVRNELMMKYGIGVMHKDISMLKIVKDILLFNGYTMPEKLGYIKGMGLTMTALWDDVVETKLFEESTDFQTPIYVIHGKYDYQVSYALARKWFEKINVPKKEFFTFENSAHSPNMEEYDKFVEVIRGIAEKSGQKE